MDLTNEFAAGKLRVKVYSSRKAMGKAAAGAAAQKIKELLLEKDEISMIFAAAPSQNEFLAALTNTDGIAWERINAFHMDEYIGLEADASQGFGNFLKNRLFDRVGFKSVNYLNGNAPDIQSECLRYAGLLGRHPADIVCMGIGENGHIAFNDPHVAFFNDTQRVKTVELDEKCRIQQVNDGCFSSLEMVPTHAITLTIPALTRGSYVYCMVPARTKAEAVRRTIIGEVSETCPASILKMHDNAVLYLDTDSASLI